MGFLEELIQFNKGENEKSYLTLGCQYEGENGFRFSVWAPHARGVNLVSDFTDWVYGLEMKQVPKTGVWTVLCERAVVGANYKYKIIQNDGNIQFKLDPYAFEFEVRPKDASVVKQLPVKVWRDTIWLTNRKKGMTRPMNIYEIHLSSWKTHPDGSWYSFSDLQQELIPYVKEMGYTHIELMPIMEHPLDASWGYQITGFFAVSSKYGTLEEFQAFVEACHLANIGVILDFVPAHFNRNAVALAYYDGTPQFEYQDSNRAVNKRWGTMNFDLGKPEVQSFLISNALFWIEEFHIDGLRVDAVSSMLYLDFDLGGWTPNEDGTNHNYQGIRFIQKLNSTILERHPDLMMIAEESSAWQLVTGEVAQGGLGFTHKWNMGWMNDTLKFFEMDPIYRKYHFDLLTFSFVYMFNEQYILPFSHDEVVHGKKSLMHKMFGDRYNQFAGLRTMLAWMMTHPGQKLSFMGNEFGQFVEWRFYEGLKWDNLTDELNQKHQNYIRYINTLYKKEKALWEKDHSNGFELISKNGEESNFVFLRKGKKYKDFLIIAFNFVPVERQQFKIKVPYAGAYEEILNTEMVEYGGTWTIGQGFIMSDGDQLEIILPALSCVILKPKRLYVSKEGNPNES